MKMVNSPYQSRQTSQYCIGVMMKNTQSSVR